MKPSARRDQPGLGPAVQFPKGGFEHPFHDSEDHVKGCQGKEHPRAVSGDFSGFVASSTSTSVHQVAELLMCALSNHIRERPNWREEMRDTVIVKKWREEALQHEVEDDFEIPSRKLTSAMVRSCYFRTYPLSLNLIPRLTTYSRSSTDTRLYATQRLG